MNRWLDVKVDQSTWPGPGKKPAFPSTFHKGSSSYELNIPAMLLMIGYLTTPTSTTGISLSEFWAWVRYLAAITDENSMRLTSSFANLDPHQKTILSDDFGMGVPMLWLCEKLSLECIVDGRYFVQKFAASAGASQRRTAKRGPNKTPDFVARDVFGKWHVIECKGTQSGIEYSDYQIGKRLPLPTGGIAQKRAIRFPPGYTGQRLVCGLNIGIEGKTDSILRIVDPELEEPFDVEASELSSANDAITRGVMSRVLRMSGFEIAAETMASPFGRDPGATLFKTGSAEDKRKEIVKERDQRARVELRDLESHQSIFSKQFIGRQLAIELPRDIMVNEKPVSRVIVKQGINREVLQELRGNPTIDNLADQSDVSWTSMVGRSTVKSDGPTAQMKFGEIFRSELILETREKRR